MTAPTTLAFDSDLAGTLRLVLRDSIQAQVQYLLDRANGWVTDEPDWADEDDFATNCETLAQVARFVSDAGLAQASKS